MIDPQHRHEAGRVEDAGGDALGGLQQTELVVRGVFLPIRLAGDQRRGGRRCVADNAPLHPVVVDDFRTGGPGGCAVRAGHVALEAGVNRAVAGHALVHLEAERPRADEFRHLLERVGDGEALRHHRADRHRGLAQRDRQEREGALEAEPDRPVVGRRQLVGRLHQGAAERVALGPAPQGGDAVAGQHGGPVVEAQALAQGQVPAAPVLLDPVALDHLRRGAEGAVHAVERVEDHVAVVAGDVREGRHRIERDEILLRDEAQGCCGLRADPGWCRDCARHDGSGSLQQRTPLHRTSPTLRGR